MNRFQTFKMKVKEVLTVIPVALLIGLGVVVTAVPERAWAATSSVPEYIPSEGTKFWVTFLSNNKGAATNEADREVKLIAAARTGATVTLTYSVDASTETHYIPAGGGEITITLDKSKVYNLEDNVGQNRMSVLVTSGTDTISLYAAARDGNYYESTFVLPEHALGNEYVVQTERTNQPGYCSEYAIVAAKDNTHITINQRETNGNSASQIVPSSATTTTLTLNKGDVYYVRSTQTFKQGIQTYYATLSGTSITADSVFAVYQADEASRAPYIGGHTQNYFLEQALPIATWGKEFIVSKIADMFLENHNIVRITAVYDGTEITIRDRNGKTTTATLSAFSTFEHPWITSATGGATGAANTNNQYDDIYIKASHPITVSSFVPNNALNEDEYGSSYGAPAVAWIPPLRQGVHKMTVGTTANDMIIFLANIVVPTNAVSSMKIDGVDLTTLDEAEWACSPFPDTDYSVIQLIMDYSGDVKHEITNDKSKFIVTTYGLGNNNAYYYASGFNTAPAAPIVFVDDNEAIHQDTLDYCNRHPGIHFTAKVDYPHTGIKWELGEDTEIYVTTADDEYEASHMYGATIGESDKIHDVRLFVYRESPITHVKDTDSVRVTLNVHPVYYDTLKTKVAAKKMEYRWDSTSLVPFGLIKDGVPKYSRFKFDQKMDFYGRTPWINYKKDSANASQWTDAHARFQIFDSLVYWTKYTCDSIFYLQLDVVPDTVMKTEYDTVCQAESFTWTGHHNAWNHLTQNDVPITTINTGEAGNFVIRDTMQSKVFPFPDSIHVLNLHVSHKPIVAFTTPGKRDSICETVQDVWTVNYSAEYADSLYYELWTHEATPVKKIYKGIRRSKTDTELAISGMSSLRDGQYILTIKAINDTTCESAEVADRDTLVIKNRPSLRDISFETAAQCYPATSFKVKYTPVDVKYVKWTVDGKIPSEQSQEVTSAPYEFEINTTDWADGTYHLHLYPVSPLGCDSLEDVKDFVINRQPIVTNVTVDSKCDEETSSWLKFTTSFAKTFKYYIVGETALSSALPVTSEGENVDGQVALDISMLNVGNTEKTYTLKIVANSAAPASCPSDTAEATFKVYPMPAVALNTLSSECHPADADKTVTFGATTTADSIKWVLKRGSDIVRQQTDKFVKRESITLTKASDLNAPGLYKFTITAIKTTHDCEVLNPEGGEIQFTIYDQAHITAGTVANKCEGENIVVPITDTYADSLICVFTRSGAEVLRDTVVIPGGSGTERLTNVTIPTGTGAGKLPASTTAYKVTVSATNYNQCGGNTVSVDGIYVHKVPSITAASLSDASLCELADQTTLNVTTDANELIYEVKKVDAVWVAPTTVAAPSSGKLTLLTDTLSAGSYTITLTPKSTTTPSCEGASFDPIPFIVHPKPVVNSLSNAVVCFSDVEATATFTATNASTYNFELKDKNGSAVTVTPTISTGSITIPLSSTMTAALSPYTIRLQAVSEYTCKSDWKESTLTINPQPAKPSNITFTEPCADATTMNVTFTKDALGNCAVAKIVETGTVTLASTPVEETSRMIPVSITGVTAGNTYTLRIYTFNNVTNCQSDSTDKTFTVWPLPTITPVDTFACENDATVDVRYSSTNAKTYTYELTGYGITTPRTDTKNAEASGYISVDISGLEANHDYTLSITAVSEKGCNTAAATTSKVTIRPRPSITLSDISDFCEGSASITINYTGLVGATACEYIVTKGSTEVATGTKTGLTAPNGSFTIDPSAWGHSDSDDDFSIELIAKANGCGSQSTEQKKSFTVNPLPTIAADAASVTLCEKEDAAVFTFTTEFADTYSYWLSGTGAPTFAETDKEVPTGGKVTITWPKDSQVDGNFTLNVTVKNGCATSAAATTTLKVNNQPEVELTISNICQDDEAGLNFNYTVSTEADRYDLHVWKADRSKHIGGDGNFALPAKPTGTIHKSFIPWGAPIGAGSYVAVMRVRNSTTGCESDSVVVPFTIHPIPTVNSNFTVQPVCMNGEPRVDFKHTHGATVKYWIDGVEKSAVTINGTEDAAWFIADISGVEAGTNHKMKLQVISGTSPACESAESTEKTFTIHPIPTITTHDTTAVYQVAGVDVRYSATNASSYTYTLTGEGITPRNGSGSASTAGLIPVNTNELNPGEYNLSVTVESEHGCSKSATSKITIHDPATVVIDEPIASNLCEGSTDPVVIHVHTTYADKFTYVVTDSGDNEKATGTVTYTNTDDTPVDKDFTLADISGWADGEYTVTVTAENTVTKVTKTKSSTFEILPKPEVVLPAKDSICHKTATYDVVFQTGTTGVKTVSYRLVKGAETKLEETDVPATSGKFTLTTDALDAYETESYTLYVTPKSADGCVGDEVSMPFYVFNNPTFVMTAPTNPCEEDAAKTVVNYTSTYANTFDYKLYNVTGGQNTPTAIGSNNVKAAATGTIELDIHALEDGDYELRATARNIHGCPVEATPVAFKIYPKPTVKIVSVRDTCDNETGTEVTFTASAEAKQYKYAVYKNGAIVLPAAPAVPTYADIPEGKKFGLDISTLSHGQYRLKLQTKTEFGCESDVDSVDFRIWQLPNVKGLAVNDTCKGEDHVTLTFIDSLATGNPAMDDALARITRFTYDLKKGTTTIRSNVAQTISEGVRKFDIPTSDLDTGKYTITLTPYSDHGTTYACEGTPKDVTFTIHTLPTITVAHIDSVCVGVDPITISDTTTFANTVKYVVKKGGAIVIPEQTISGLSGDGTKEERTITLPTGTGDGKLGVGTYTIELTASNAHLCHEAKISKTFTVNPIPSLSFKSHGRICQDETNVEMELDTLYTKTLSYRLVKVEDDMTETEKASATDIPNNGKIAFNPSASGLNLEAGKYKLYATPKSPFGCEGTEKSVIFYINLQPTIGVAGTPVQQCGDGVELKVKYAVSEKTSTYTCTLWNNDYSAGAWATSAPQAIGGTDSTFVIPTSDMQLGTYHIVLQAVSDSGCVSEPDTTDVTLEPVYLEPIVTDTTICFGGDFDWYVKNCSGEDILHAHMSSLKEGKQVTDTLKCNNGQCNPIYKLDLKVWPEYSADDAPYKLCAGDTLFWRGETITTGGKHEHIEAGVALHGCDSIYRIEVNLIEPKTTTTSDTVFYCYGEKVTINDKAFELLTPGLQTLRDTLRDEGGLGCDTAYYEMTVIVGEHHYYDTTVVECGQFYWYVTDSTYTQSTTHEVKLKTTDGHNCDSIHVLNLTINPIYDSTKVYIIHKDQLPFTAYGKTFTQSEFSEEIPERTKDSKYSTIAGCDSIYHVTVIVSPKPVDTTEVTICDNELPYKWLHLGEDYGTYNQAGEYAKEVTDSIHLLHLTVNKTFKQTHTEVACETFTWELNGQTYTETGKDTIFGASYLTGCDSIHILDLTIEHNEVSTVYETVCEGVLKTVGVHTKIWEADETFDVIVESKESGCTSKVTYNVTVAKVEKRDTTRTSFCEGDSILWRGTYYHEGGTYNDTIPYDDSGCAKEIYTLELTANPSYKGADERYETVEVHPDALPFKWEGHRNDTLLYDSGDYYDNLKTKIFGCDSIHHIHFHVGLVTRDTLQDPLIGCDTVEWTIGDRTHIYTESHTGNKLASDTVWYVKDDKKTYDTIHFRSIEVYKPYILAEDAFTVCPNTSFTWHGEQHELAEVGDSLMTYIGHNDLTGCDSTFTRMVHVAEELHEQETVVVCPNELPYKWVGHKADTLLYTSGDYIDEHTSIWGCDSTYVLNFTVKTVNVTNVEATICQSKTYVWLKGTDTLMTIPGNEVGEKKPYYYDYTDNGCDVQDTLLLTVTPPATPIVTDTTICYGEIFDWVVKGCDGVTDVTLMKGLTAETDQTIMLDCEGYECNPIYELHLHVRKEFAGDDEYLTLCAGETYDWFGQLITEAGTYERRVGDLPVDGATQGCDSVYRIIVDKIVPEYKTINQNACYGEPVIFNNKTYTDLPVGQQVLLDTIHALGGCDSLYLRLNLTVGQRYYDSIVVTECDKYEWAVNGHTYYHSGIYSETMSTVDGCDSVFVLNLTINESYESYESYDIHETELPYTVHEYTYTAAGTYDRVFHSIGGCDSIYHITITTHPLILPKDTMEKTICADVAPYNWRGTDYAQSGWYSKTTTIDGKDTVHVLHLTVNKTYSDTIYVHSCGAYTWYGMDYTTTGNYTHVATSSCGCDSVEVLALTIGQPTASTVDVTACQYELTTVGNHTFVASADESFTETLRNAAGCDSVITYNVTVTAREYTAVEADAFCEGTEYSWFGHTYTEAGTYYDTVFDANGCATTIHTLELTTKPKYRFDEDVEVSELALPYIWVGHKGMGTADTLLRTNGDYYERLVSQVSGCDSIYHIHFHVNFVERDTVSAQGCDSVEWRGKTYTESQLASDTIFTDVEHLLYDTVHFCNITVNYNYSEVEPEFTICQNEAFEWHGTTFAANSFEAGDSLLTYVGHNAATGCDSTYNVTVHVIASFRSEESYNACPNELPYNWRGQLLNAAGQYTDVRPSETGCDSTYVLNFTVQTITVPDTETQTVCQETQVSWHGLEIETNTPGEYTYYKWYTAAGECDSTYHRLNLTVYRTEHDGGYDTIHICNGESQEWHEHSYTVAKTAANYHAETNTYEADYDDIRTNIFGCDSLDAHLHLVMHQPYNITLGDTTICNSYDWNGAMTITESGTYSHSFTTAFGCNDSTVTRTFVVYHSETLTEDTVRACNSYYWPRTHQEYTESDTYEHHVPQMGGACDSIYYLPLIINQSKRDTISVKYCDTTYTWGKTGEKFTSTGIYEVETVPGANGCDSTVVLKLQLPTLVHVSKDTTACDNFVWKGGNYPVSTVIYDTVKTEGCDSIVYTRLNLTVNHSVSTRDTIEVCREYNENGEGYTHTTDDILHLETKDGCDSTVYRHIIINHPDSIYDTIRTCEAYTRNGHTYLYSQDDQQDFLCDSVLFLHIIIDRDKDSTLYITAWDSYTWEGDTYTESTTDIKTLSTVNGCDSVVTLNLTINDSKDTVETQIACESFYWEWSDSTYLLSTIDTVTHRIDVGLISERDSTRILQLSIGNKKLTAVEESACDFFIWHGTEYLESGVFTYEYKDTCEGNVDTLHLTIYHQVKDTIRDTYCDVATINGRSYFRDTTFTDNLKTEHGCDSTVTYILTFTHRHTMTIREQACGSYTWEGTTYTKSGVYNKVLTDIYGCDSVVTLQLSIQPLYHHEFDVTSCSGSYVWNNEILDVAGDYEHTYSAVNGCDSVVTLHLSLPSAISPMPLDTTVCDFLWWNGRKYTETGMYSETFTSAVTGCDSVARLYLTIAAHPTGEMTETAVDWFPWGSETYYESGVYQQRFAREEGCDSIVTLYLTITNPLPITEIADTACDAYTWDSETFYESGVYTRNFPTLDGRDSIVKLSLVINHDTAVSITDKLCGPYEWNGVTYTETGVYTQIFQRASGCDSVVTLTLTLCERFETAFTATEREIYTWDGVDYTESGVYTNRYKTVIGCDSVVTMMLTILSNVYEEISDTVCSEYMWADSVFTHSTIHAHVFPAANGCDSVVTLTLVVHEPVYTDLYDTVKICDTTDPSYSDHYTLPWGEQVSHTGIYSDTLTSELSQCDSIVRFHLQWCAEELCADTTHFTVDDQCESYVWDGVTYNTTGSYTRHYRLENGCDSVVIMRLNILPSVHSVMDINACDSLYWESTGQWYYESGFYYDTVQAANGCDSIMILHAVIGHAGDSILELTSCDAYTINGETFTESGTYIQHLLTTTGCDSTLTIHLTLNPSADTIVDETACDSMYWELPDTMLYQTGFYPQVLSSVVTGCDSVVNLHLIVYGSKEVFELDSLQNCDSLIWGDEYAGIDTLYLDGTYTKTFQTSVGCDSTVTKRLTLIRHDEVVAPDTASCDSLIWNNLRIFESGTYTDTLESELKKCDSIVTINVTINPTYHTEYTDSVAPAPYWIWPLNGDTLPGTGDYTDTVAAVTGCDSIVTLHLIMTDSIILRPEKPFDIDTFGYCPGYTAEIPFNLKQGYPTCYILRFDTTGWGGKEFSPEVMSQLDTTDLPATGGIIDSLITVFIPDGCPAGVYKATLQLFDYGHLSQSDEYPFYISVNIKNAIVSMWKDVVAIDNHEDKYSDYQWYKNDQPADTTFMDTNKQYYSDHEVLDACYRAKLLVAVDDTTTTWMFTCDTCFHLLPDSVALIAYPTPVPSGIEITLEVLGISTEELAGSSIRITTIPGVPVQDIPIEAGERRVATNVNDRRLSAGIYVATLIPGDKVNLSNNKDMPNVKFIVF